MSMMKVNYLGLELENPVIVASSPFTASAGKIRRLEESGAGAVVLKSIFEEQIAGEAAMLERYSDYPEAADYLTNYLGEDYMRLHVELIQEAKRAVKIPVIASINCYETGQWVDYARRIEAAGADAIELNIYLMPSDIKQKSSDVERAYLDIVSLVVKAVKIPVSVKLSMRFTNVLNMAAEIYYRGAKGVVLYNRFFEPDIDVKNKHLVSFETLSAPGELRNSLRTIALATPQLPELDFAVSTGVHTGEDVVKSLLAGARAVQVCSALYIHGLERINEMTATLRQWMDANNYSNVDEFRGRVNFRGAEGNDALLRVQYMKFFPKGDK